MSESVPTAQDLVRRRERAGEDEFAGWQRALANGSSIVVHGPRKWCHMRSLVREQLVAAR
ncbi:MAG: hypothetical protein ACTHMY_26930 [Solirubrobacteraceae bacterium]